MKRVLRKVTAVALLACAGNLVFAYFDSAQAMTLDPCTSICHEFGPCGQSSQCTCFPNPLIPSGGSCIAPG